MGKVADINWLIMPKAYIMECVGSQYFQRQNLLKLFAFHTTSSYSQTTGLYILYINIQYVSQIQQNFVYYLLGQHVSILIESSSGPSKNKLYILCYTHL